MTDQHTLLKEMGWQEGLTLASCGECQIVSLLPEAFLQARCYHCGSPHIELMDPEEDKPPHLAPPELILDTAYDERRVQGKLASWAKGFFFRPRDLTPQKLNERLRLVYIPIWLMDTHLNGPWKAEVGFDYQVQSHRESYKDGRWRTQKVERTQQDWEPRAGMINKPYENVPADAIEQELAFWPLVRQRFVALVTVRKAHPYDKQEPHLASYCLPNRIPQDALTDMVPQVLKIAKRDVRDACRADHIRKFQWAPEFGEQNWTKMLYPLWSTWYLDDDERPKMIYVDAVSGRGRGERSPSMRRAWQISLIFGAVAALFMIFGFISAVSSGDVSRVFNLGGIGLALLAVPLILILYVTYEKGRTDQFKPL